MSGGNNKYNQIGSGNSTQSCGKLSITTTLYSPNSEVIDTLSKGDKLDIINESPQGPLVAVDELGNIAGTIVTKIQLELTDCMDKGFLYVAIIKEINGGNCSIIIKSKK